MDPTTDAHVALQRLRDALDRGRLRPLLERHGVDLLVVHGSVISPGSEPSDLDLVVGHDGRADLLALQERLYDHVGYEHIDLLDLQRAGIVARGEALGHGRLLFELQPGLFAERQVVALTTMWDTRWMRDLELAGLAGA